MKKIFITSVNLIWIFIFLFILFIVITGFGIMSDAPIVWPWYFYLWLGICAISIFISIWYSSKKYLFLALPLIILIIPIIFRSIHNLNISYNLLYRDPVKTCGSIKDVGPRSMCYLNLGTTRGDISICDRSEYYKGDCYYEIITKQTDSNLCEKMPDIKHKDYCYRDFGICNKIIDKVQEDLCRNKLVNKN